MTAPLTEIPASRLLLLAAGNLCICTNALSVSALAAPLAETYSISIGSAADFAVSYGLAYAVLAPFAALAVEFVRAQTLLLTGLVLFAAANFASIWAVSPETLHLYRILAAFGGVLFTPASVAVAGTLVEKRLASRAISLVMLGLPLSALVGVPGLILVTTPGGLDAAFAAMGAASLGVVLVLFFLRDAFSLPSRRGPVRFDQILGSPRGWFALTTTAVQTTAQYGVYTFAPVFFGAAGYAAETVVVILTIFGIGAVSGNLIGGFAGDRFGKVRTQRIALVAMCLAFLGLYLVPQLLLIAVTATLLWGLSGYAFQAPQQARLIAIVPQSSRAILSLNSSAVYVGISLGAVLGGLAVEFGRVEITPLIGVVVASLALLLTFLSKAVPLYSTGGQQG